ncbi:MAG: glycoside hydrolase family 127 protein [Chitinophagaceae bacterium]|nr:glycoside hydrolase family 127 protein [Chitinophagaceae bacterium]MCW5927925.1 glycoside hydrolase family 127 protein [Chitinophagaceae bacterium]
MSANKKNKNDSLRRRKFLKAIGLLTTPAIVPINTAKAIELAGSAAITENSKKTAPPYHKPWRALHLNQVKVSGAIGTCINHTIDHNLLALDPEVFLEPFRSKTLRGEGYSDYIGLGKLLDAAVRFAAYTQNEKVLQLKNKLIGQTIQTQEADGYIGTMVKTSRMWKLWDVHEIGYIILGLTTDYQFFNTASSLRAAKKLADYVIANWNSKPKDWQSWGQLGIENNILQLYRVSLDRRYLNFVTEKLNLPAWRIDLDLNTIGKTHMYTDIDMCLAQFDLFAITSQQSLLQSGKLAAQFLLDRNGAVVTGAAGLWESWNTDQGGRKYLGETCATAYQIRLMDKLMQMEGNARYGDMMDRMLYNALFAAQSPDGRQLRYFIPMEGERVYFKHDTYCCPNNFRRIVADLPGMIFYQTANGVAVNLYSTSEANIQLSSKISLTLRQQTSYPATGNIKLDIEPSEPASFSVALRIPAWCNKAVVKINGTAHQQKIVAGSFLQLERHWQPGDQVTLQLPMSLRLVAGRVRQAGRVAVLRGPQVFCLNPQQQKQLANTDAADLTNFIIDPDSLELINEGEPVLNSVSCKVKMGDRLLTIGKPMELKLTPFPDPEGKVVYFRIPDLAAAQPDELLKGNMH